MCTITRLVILLVFAISTAGCGRTYLPVKPSPALTADCDYPALEGETWRALAETYEMRGKALKECTERMRALRQ